VAGKPGLRAPSPSSAAERARRKHFLVATLVTCAALAMIGGAIHVVRLGERRMDEMRAKATYDLAEMPQRIRAAGEEATRHALMRAGLLQAAPYTEVEAKALLLPEQWADVETMITIPAGPFTMGTDRPRADPQDRPAHEVVLPAYRIDKYPVTNAQYARFVAATGHRPPLSWPNGRIPRGELLRPVTMVSWYDADAYCRWAGKRLPTEAEWEKAARGTDGRRWPWGDHMDPERLNTYYSVGSTTDVRLYTKGASPYGVMDMAGNVSEWTADDFAPYPGSDAPAELFRPKVAVPPRSRQDRAFKVADFVEVEGSYKVLRGGSWKSDPFSTAAYHRNFALPNMASDFFGFRCAQDVREAEGREGDGRAVKAETGPGAASRGGGEVGS